MRPPSDCQNMTDLRAQIDQMDRDLIALLAKRAAYIDRAAELKPAENLPARIPARVQDVLDNVHREARAQGLDPDLAVSLWTQLINWSIAREERVLGPDAKGLQE